MSISRRSFLSGAVATVAGAGVLLGKSEPIQAQSGPTGDEQWTQPGGNAASTAANINGVGPTGDVSIAWEGGISGHYDSIPGAVVDGTVYTSGTAMGALDASDGTEQWTYNADIPDKEYPEPPVADIETPTVLNGTVFAPVRIGVSDAGNSFHAAIIAVDAETGTKQWRVDAPVSHVQFSPVTAVEGSIFVTGPDIDGGEGRFVYALHPDDGSVRWRQPSTKTEWYGDTPIVADELVFISEESGVKAYDAASGELVWDALSRVKDLSLAMVSEETLFVSESTEPGATIIALEAASGNERWKTAYSGDIGLGIHTADTERLYVSTSEDDNDIIALDRADGSELWQTTIPQPPKDDGPRKPIPDHGMARVGELLYVGGAGLDPSDGSIVWKQGIEDPWIAGYTLYAVAGGQMYFGDDGLVVMDGTETQTATTPTPQPNDTDQREDSDQQNSTGEQIDATRSPPSDGTTQQSGGTTPQTDPDRTDAATDTETTATDGPGFGVLTTLAGVGVGAWRYLTTE